MKKYDIGVALLPKKASLVSFMKDKGWITLYEGKEKLILKRPVVNSSS